jgi:hypothetical protein
MITMLLSFNHTYTRHVKRRGKRSNAEQEEKREGIDDACTARDIRSLMEHTFT